MRLQNQITMPRAALLLFSLTLIIQPTPSIANNNDGIDCPPCDKSECLVAMQQLNCGECGYARDVCGCCFRCAATESEMCGGFRNLFGQCGFDLYCKPQPIPYQSDQPIPRYGYCARLEGVRNFQNDLIESKIQMLEVVSGEMREQLGRKPFNNKQPHSHISNANNDIITEDTYNAFQMDDSNNMWAQGGYYGFLAGNAGITGGGAKEGSIFTTKNQMKWSECEPPCSHQFCLDNPRAICSAKNILRPYEMCGSGDGGGGGGGGNQCVHTSCLACGYEPDTSFCGQCEEPTDQKCMNKFGKCVKTMRRVTRKDPQSYIKQGLVSYECAVPECTNVNNYLK